MIELTSKAVEQVKEFAKNENLPPMIRVLVKGSGCAGLSGDMMFDDVVSDMDEQLEQDGVKIIVDCMSIHYLDNAVIDFVQTEYTMGFKFLFKDENKKSCGCGSSFSV
jgi:iron-sulfur cluster assembly accessory protein